MPVPGGRVQDLYHSEWPASAGCVERKTYSQNLGKPGVAVSKAGWPKLRWPLAGGLALLADLGTEETLSSVFSRGPWSLSALPRAMILL